MSLCPTDLGTQHCLSLPDNACSFIFSVNILDVKKYRSLSLFNTENYSFKQRSRVEEKGQPEVYIMQDLPRPNCNLD